ncbi:hypothetical protein Scani_09170 [Streptomyces caniferus]|uniref:Uncharacterized protein n=1 Tax=Streptomyces caniferus TaxID=285557 RepID=A0A640S0G3_9ACTN|nr:hypothetical protein Scani_09170 [Streptomyces caniferus]
MPYAYRGGAGEGFGAFGDVCARNFLNAVNSVDAVNAMHSVDAVNPAPQSACSWSAQGRRWSSTGRARPRVRPPSWRADGAARPLGVPTRRGDRSAGPARRVPAAESSRPLSRPDP